MIPRPPLSTRTDTLVPYTTALPFLAAGLSAILERFLRPRPNIQFQVIHADEQEKMTGMLRRRDIYVAYGEMVRPPRGLSLTPMEPLEIVLLSPPETDLPAQVQIEHIGKIPMICPPPSEERRRLQIGRAHV